nr:universal stress protein [Syntrophales bacterium]
EYLNGIQASLSGERVVVTKEIQEGNIVHSIIEYTKKNAVDLIAITTQGFSRMRRMALGHVALKLLQDSHVPLLMIKPQANRKLN